MKTEEVKKLADLSRIKVSKGEIKEFTKQLSDILSYVNKIQEYKFIAQEYKSDDKIAELREDQVIQNDGEDLIKQFSDHEGNLLKVKKIL